jgi:hypothetical protein
MGDQNISEKYTVSVFQIEDKNSLPSFPSLKMETVCYSETLVSNYQTVILRALEGSYIRT